MNHELTEQALRTYSVAQDGLEIALSYLGKTEPGDTSRIRLACSGVVAACDALKAAASAYSHVHTQVSRASNAKGGT